MTWPELPRYGPFARFYDVVSGEWPVYRRGREVGIAALELRGGQQVLDIGCGTGLNFPLLRGAVGPTGGIVGIDASAPMLAGAQRRVRRRGWSNVDIRQGDAAHLDGVGARFDAVLYTYALSIIDDWRSSWAQAVARTRPGGRIAVVDMTVPTGRWRWLSPLARLAMFTGGADPRRHPWRLVEEHLGDVRHEVLRGGHIHVVSGTVLEDTVVGDTVVGDTVVGDTVVGDTVVGDTVGT